MHYLSIRLAGLWLGLISGAGAQTGGLEAQLDGAVEPLALSTPAFSASDGVPGPIYWQHEITKLGTDYLRLHIASVVVPEALEVTLRLRDRNGRRIRDYSAEELGARGAFWTAVIPGDYALLAVIADEVPEGFSLSIDQLAYQSYGGAPLSTVGEDEKQHIAEYSDSALIMTAAKPVAKLLFLKNNVPRVCTGFLISATQLMTNHHCVSEQSVCDSLITLFGYQFKPNGRLDFGEQFECASVLAEDFELDYAVLELRGRPGDTWGELALSAADPASEEVLFLIQHPAGEPKQISKINCSANIVPVKGRAPETDFTHTCDTIGGSSGSPLFDDTGKLIGLHHYGYGEVGEDETWTENRAVRMVKILSDLTATAIYRINE